MPHFYVNPKNIHNERFSIQGEECHHLQHVLRKKIGDIIRLFDGENHAYRVRIDTISGDTISGTIESQEASAESTDSNLHLFQALPKGNKFDFIIEKCTELGVSSITPVVSSRCMKKILPERDARQYDRWKKIACSAAEQCGRKTIPTIYRAKNFLDALNSSENVVQLLPWEGEEKLALKEALHHFVKKSGRKKDAIHIWIGPEGGFSLKEIILAREHGVKTVTLGERILRTETAGMITLALIQYEFDMLG